MLPIINWEGWIVSDEKFRCPSCSHEYVRDHEGGVEDCESCGKTIEWRQLFGSKVIDKPKPKLGCLEWIPIHDFDRDRGGFYLVTNGDLVGVHKWDPVLIRWFDTGSAIVPITHFIPIPETPKSTELVRSESVERLNRLDACVQSLRRLVGALGKCDGRDIPSESLRKAKSALDELDRHYQCTTPT